mgnify:CR=1 FL=1
MQAFFHHLLQLSLEAAPWLLLGLIATALIRAFVPDRAMKKWIGGTGFGSVLRAAVVGVPLPLCSCGVIPAAIGLRRQGASPGATASFLVSTPETGVDSISISYALLGPFLTVARPVAAVISAVATGIAVQAVSVKQAVAQLAGPGGATVALDVASSAGGQGGKGGDSCCHEPAIPPQTSAASCCHEEPEPAETEASCCHGDDAGTSGEQPGPWRRVVQGFQYATTTLLDDVSPWIAVGLGVAALMLTVFEPATLSEVGRGPLAMLVLGLVGVPMYVCSVGATPLAAGLLVAGVSPGAVLVFLLAGPATNVATIGVVRRELGTPAVVAYLACIVGVAVLLGLATDAIVGAWGLNIAGQAEMHGHAIPRVIAYVALGLLLLLAIKPLRRRLLW